jgi:hypothetical protein
VGLCQELLPSQARELACEAADLICETRLVHDVGFISEKGKATAKAVQQSPETGGLLLR